MNELLKAGAVCLMASIMSGSAFADEAKVVPPPKENKPQNLITSIIEETKLSDDGSLTYEEFKAARETVIKKRTAEMKAAREKRDKEKFLALDKNKDGKVSKTELLELQKKFEEGPRGKFGRGRGPQEGQQGMRHHGMGQKMGKGRGPQGGQCDMNCGGNGPRPDMGPRGMNCGDNGPRGGMQGQPPCFGKDQKRGGGYPGMSGQQRPGFEMIMIQADKDKDGSLSKEEVNSAILEFFDKLDKNKDGKLEKSELSTGRHSRRGERRVKSSDKDTK